MNYQSRVRGSNGGAGTMMAAAGNQTLGANLGGSYSLSGNATGPALVLIGIVALLVLDYVWTRGQQGGR